ncbi:hypothetical protein OIU84_016254 [Salix udensis]|uniref:Uncharacterized protein n=1 Tax=Salix udensis TaxID=889485 RepID=A0AAD6J9W7_9ROSI|nr:hypothetical protein OIU84_016254 [Salix udensis]
MRCRFHSYVNISWSYTDIDHCSYHFASGSSICLSNSPSNKGDPGPISWFWSMGTFKKEKCGANQECPEKKVRAYMFSLWSFLASVAGGLLLLWWDYEFHPTNSQLWMVPLGLILFFTPAIAWFAVVVSGTCNYKVDDDNSHKTSELVLQVRRLS